MTTYALTTDADACIYRVGREFNADARQRVYPVSLTLSASVRKGHSAPKATWHLSNGVYELREGARSSLMVVQGNTCTYVAQRELRDWQPRDVDAETELELARLRWVGI